MANFPVKKRRLDPYRNFKFKVRMDGRIVAGVSKMSALKRSTEVVKHRGSDAPSTDPGASNQPKWEIITLERGVTHDAEFEQWANAVWNLGAGTPEEPLLADLRRDLVIEVYDEAGKLREAYEISGCWVSEFQALPDLDANANAVAIHFIKLQNEGWERLAASKR